MLFYVGTFMINPLNFSLTWLSLMALATHSLVLIRIILSRSLQRSK